jgi:hypothetical protein
MTIFPSASWLFDSESRFGDRAVIEEQTSESTVRDGSDSFPHKQEQMAAAVENIDVSLHANHPMTCLPPARFF